MKWLSVLLVLLVAGCGGIKAPPDHAGHEQHQPVVSDSAFNPTDLAWLQLMIPMDEQLLRVLELAARHTVDPELRKLAAGTANDRRAELTRLKALRAKAKAPTANQHAGHDMPGMMTEPEIVALGNARGAAFDRLLARNLREHVEQSIVVAQSIATAGEHPEVKSLAASIVETRSTQLMLLPAK
ncbi:DUF305 domain-containing protein [Kribbella sp. NBC_01245]|uniref:DUF305 domain-containing protein n=1 Tax=Kribbella sp. NBC_01245 TaxID=2903578 RepID=UPI002E2BFF70|nr:DUF305 domain-containing protein [Kribbella sp. NBC_01245]